MARKRIRLPLNPVAPEEGVVTREAILQIGGTEVGRQSVGVEATQIDFGVHEIGEGVEVVVTCRDADKAENWSEPTERRFTPFKDQTAPSAPTVGDIVFEDVPEDAGENPAEGAGVTPTENPTPDATENPTAEDTGEPAAARATKKQSR